jgi:predicted esterase
MAGQYGTIPGMRISPQTAGPSPREARLAVILIHGRGSNAEDILGLGQALQIDDIHLVAPEAPGNSWYPYSFLSPIDQNEPGISNGLATIASILESLGTDGLTSDRVALMGFSQGACLSLEFAARHARRYAAVIGLSGGVIGPPGTPRNYPGSMEGTPVFLGCSDVDPHIPVERVHESADVFRRLGAEVDARIYPRMAHTVNLEELRAARALLAPASPADPTPSGPPV